MAAFMQKTVSCDLLRDLVSRLVTRSCQHRMNVHWRAKFEKRIGSPVHFRTYNPLVNGAEISGLFSAAGCARRVMSALDDCSLESEVRKADWLPSRDSKLQ